MFKEKIQKLLVKAFADVGVDLPEITVDSPTQSVNGDYASNVALVAAKKLGRNPMELAQEIQKKLEEAPADFIAKIEVAQPGFINFWIKDKNLIEATSQDITFKNIGKGKKIVVEYSSPNIAKPFTIGHLRSTIIGDAIANLLQAIGYEVARDNHIGDWGTQFGKQIYAIKVWGNIDEIERSDRPVKLLVDLYVKFHNEAEKDPTLDEKAREWFKKLEDGDLEARELWEKCIEWSWKEFESIYTDLGVSFTENNGRGYGEAFFEDKMGPVVEELKKERLMKEGENGAQLVFFPNDHYPPLMILKKDGATLYSTRDLATDKFRIEHYGKDVLIINEVGAEQSLYFKQLYKLEEMLGWFNSTQRIHVKHGLYRFKEGKMSTRKGNVIWLEDVLIEAKKRAAMITAVSGDRRGGWVNPDDIEEIIEKDKAFSEGSRDADITKIAIGAIKWNDLKRGPEQDIAFDWDEILNMQGNSGPYLQYVYARTRSVLVKSGLNERDAFDFAQAKMKLNIEERQLALLLVRFDEIVIEAAVNYAPNILATYLFDVAQAFNLFYQKCPILKAPQDVKSLRLLITKSAGETIKSGLYLLGIKAPEQM